MLQNIIGGLLALIVIVIALGFLLPDRVTMEREITINAPTDTVFAHIGNFDAWNAWSPWATIDPDAQFSISGEGIGHRMEWKSDHRQVGNGSQEITAIDPPNSLSTYLEFESMGNAKAHFNLTPTSDGGTKVVWSFETNMREGMALYMKPVATYMGFFMENMLGPEYEKGLADLKKVAEAG